MQQNDFKTTLRRVELLKHAECYWRQFENVSTQKCLN